MMEPPHTDEEYVLPPLLRLPPELRTMIYEYALSSPDGYLHYRESQSNDLSPPKPVFCVLDSNNSSKTPSKRAIPDEFNQLKYVNRKLYQETAGTEVRYNTLVFESFETRRGLELSGCRNLCSFLNSCARKDWLKDIEIRATVFPIRNYGMLVDTLSDLSRSHSTIVSLSTSNPGVTIRYA
ncbi:uncharacterized protein EI97DRAFT_233526 [Westerdykella ornata]|uniref:F-box domain-containing protein n=1 Tax=Westerdykella ornata TaxID=318751 RepID=A0A6A6J6I9_WESOR|nr:uncharacterized protein EI97DRAFT_233526 [Westerdykella ornata]KAF2272190.1 hypothetical protein EI97DRAFT_233526 [Westerdykella ornata]